MSFIITPIEQENIYNIIKKYNVPPYNTYLTYAYVARKVIKTYSHQPLSVKPCDYEKVINVVDRYYRRFGERIKESYKEGRL